MASPYGNLQSKLERAICAYLVLKGCGTKKDIFPAESDRTRSFPNTTINTGIATPDVKFTGNYRIPVIISVKGSAALAPGAAPGTPREAFDARVALTGDMLNQTENNQNLQATAVDVTSAGRALAGSSDPAERLLNADMVDFTIQGWFEMGFGKGEAMEEGCNWEIVILFDAVCCGFNVD